MKFLDSIGYLYHNRISDAEFIDPFLLYCRLSDLCKSSYEDKRKVLLFYQVDKKINLAKAILNKDCSIESRYSEVQELLSEASFLRLVESIKGIVFPNIKKQETPKTPKQPKPQQKKQTIVQAVVEKSEEPEEVETRTPLTNSYRSSTDKEFIIGVSIVGGVILTLVLLITFACLFDWPWAFWQWFIGIGGGLLLVIILGLIVGLFNENMVVDYYVLGTIILGICILVNFLLVLICKGNYKIIFACFSVLELLCGTALAFATNDECEDGWCWSQVAEIFITIVFFIIAIMCI